MQTRELREHCERRGWTVVGEYVDTGISGAKDRRPELDRLMADAHKRRSLLPAESPTLEDWQRHSFSALTES
jgi:DNA invertase Pin-like site-specific DNA recombinase